MTAQSGRLLNPVLFPGLMIWCVYLCGVYCLGLAIFHIFFWKIFNWREELSRAAISTRAILQIANLRLIYLFLLVAFLCFQFPTELISTGLGRAFLAGMSLFWLGRLIEQFIFLPYNKPMIHILSGVFAVGTILFAVPFLMNQQSLPESTSPLPTTPREIVSIAAHDTLVYWFDDVQSDPGNILERPDTRTLPETEACEWVRRHSEEASQAVITAMTTEFHLGWAVLAGFLDIRSLLPVIIEKWTRIEDDVAYNGETPIEGRADLSYFRALQGIAFVIEHLAEKPLKQAVRLTPSQRKRLQARAKLGDEAALAILDAVN